MRRAILAVLLLSLGAASDAQAALRALLIGVSGYPTLPPTLHLSGPLNDVKRMRQVLTARGFKPEQIEVLADGLPGAALPTRANILDALARLAAQSNRGDIVVVHFAGHGSQQPAPEGGSALEPTFLPHDIGSWRKDQRTVLNAIRGIELREAADRITARGAFLWAVFDACHSARLVRGAEGDALRYRHVEAGLLGVPQVEMDRAASGASTRGGSGADFPPVLAGSNDGASALFYASQAYEQTPEMPLPAARPGASVHGLFSFVVAQALERAQPMSYRQLAQYVLTEYRAQVNARATPLFAGNGLDTLVLEQRSERQMQWPLQLDGAGLGMPVGSLAGINPGAVLAVLPSPVAGLREALGHVSVTSTLIDRAVLAPVAHDGRPAPALAALRAGMYLRLLTNPLAFELRIAVDRRACAARCALADAVARLKQDGVPGVLPVWLDSTDGADIVLEQMAERIAVLPPSARADALAARAGGPGVALREKGDAAGPAALADRIATALHAIARTRNLMRIAERLMTQTPTSLLATELSLERGRSGKLERIFAATTPTLKTGDRIVLTLTNKGRVPLDVTVLYLDADHGVTALFPSRAGEANRLDGGAKQTVLDIDIRTPPVGIETLMVIAVEATPLSEQRDYSSLQQPALLRRRGGSSEELDAFADAAFAEYARRGAARPAAPPAATSVQLFTVSVQP